jgi:hypothetical protein
MAQQHCSVLAQQTFRFEGWELEDEVGRGRSGKDGIPQGRALDVQSQGVLCGSTWKGMDKDEETEVLRFEGLVWGSCNAKPTTGRKAYTVVSDERGCDYRHCLGKERKLTRN